MGSFFSLSAFYSNKFSCSMTIFLFFCALSRNTQFHLKSNIKKEYSISNQNHEGRRKWKMGSTIYSQYKEIIDNNTKNAKVIDGLVAQRFISFKKDLLATGLSEASIKPLIDETEKRLFSVCGTTPELMEEFKNASPVANAPTLVQSCQEALAFADREDVTLMTKVDQLVEASMKLYMVAQMIVDYHYCDNHALQVVNQLKQHMITIQDKINTLTPKTPAA